MGKQELERLTQWKVHPVRASVFSIEIIALKSFKFIFVDDDFPDGRVPDNELGIIPRALNDIFDNLRIGETVESFVRVSFVELYNEEIFDLLSGYNDQTRLR